MATVSILYLIFLLCVSIELFQCGIISDMLNIGSKKQRLIVKGRLLCGSTPAANVNLKMFDLVWILQTNFLTVLLRGDKIAWKYLQAFPSSYKCTQVDTRININADPGFDDEMSKTVTNKNGEFLLDGVNEERTPIDGIVKIYHDCDDWLPCQRRWKMKIPNQYIIYADSKDQNKTTLDIGTWNLEVRLHDEDRDCYH